MEISEYPDVISEELDVLTAIFPELQLIPITDEKRREGFVAIFDLTCSPRTGGDFYQKFCQATIRVELPSGYPKKMPVFSVTQSACLVDNDIKRLKSSMQIPLDELYESQSNECGCCYQLLEFGQECLDSMNATGECQICLMPLFESSSDSSSALPEDAACRTVCFHTFHNECLIEWWCQQEWKEREKTKNDMTHQTSLNQRALAGDVEAKRVEITRNKASLEHAQKRLVTAKSELARSEAALVLDPTSTESKNGLKKAKATVARLQGVCDSAVAQEPKLVAVLEEAEAQLARAKIEEKKACEELLTMLPCPVCRGSVEYTHLPFPFQNGLDHARQSAPKVQTSIQIAQKENGYALSALPEDVAVHVRELQARHRQGLEKQAAKGGLIVSEDLDEELKVLMANAKSHVNNIQDVKVAEQQNTSQPLEEHSLRGIRSHSDNVDSAREVKNVENRGSGYKKRHRKKKFGSDS